MLISLFLTNNGDLLMTNHSSIAPEIVAHAAYFSAEPIVSIVRITDGSINDTYEVKTDSGFVFILQKMSTLFKPNVMDNLALVTPYVQARGVLIPCGIKTVDGEAYKVNGDGSWYRALSFIEGKTIHDSMTTAQVHSAGRLVGSFHSALASCREELAIALPHYHDTPFYFERMERVVRECTDEMKRETLSPIVAEINVLKDSLIVDVRTLPQRIIHADLKTSNIRFSEEGEALALIDMDTMMRGSVVTEMGDAFRSWCGTAGEDNSEQVFDAEIFKAGMKGYIETAEGITEKEIVSIAEGIRILTIELASRFVTDAYEESYFARSSKYPSLYEQCKTKAENQLLFLKAFEGKRGSL
jgi:Ser/Thr protein kinase RdoA (MazF antagonist)